MDTIIHDENEALFRFVINLQGAELFALKARQKWRFSRVSKARCFSKKKKKIWHGHCNSEGAGKILEEK